MTATADKAMAGDSTWLWITKAFMYVRSRQLFGSMGM